MNAPSAPAPSASDITFKNDPRFEGMSHHDLNALLNLYDADGNIQFDADRAAARRYVIDVVNRNTQFFHSLEEKLDFLFTEHYYEKPVWDQYAPTFVKELYKRAYAKRFRFDSYMGAMKFFGSYAMKTFDGKTYLERFEDRVVATALYLARGDEALAEKLVDEIIAGRFQPATPTFLNAGKAQRGELVSCFLVRCDDSMESIARGINASLQLSKRGGGVALLLTNIREMGAPIKNIENQASGVIPVMKLLEDSFSYANQLGARQGAGAVYISAHHPDVLKVLDTKRENADEKIRIKTLSLGIVIPDITFELAARDEDMYLFSPHSVEKVYGVPFSDISVTAKYHEMVADPRIRKTKIRARELFTAIAEVQFESGYPYMLFEDTATAANPMKSRITMSNLCSEILQENAPSSYNEDLSYNEVGRDISCNLGSLNIALALDGGDLGGTIEAAVRGLTAVSDLSDIQAVPSIANGNRKSHAIGLGQMNLHGFLGRERIHYDSPEAVDFTSVYFAAVRYHAIRASNLIAIERGETFDGFERSAYADGSLFEQYTTRSWAPQTDTVKALLKRLGMKVPTKADWVRLAESVREHGVYNAYLLAVPPTGSISYINNSTASIHPIAARVEARKEGKIGRAYYPAPHLTNDNLEFFKDAFEYGPEALLRVYAAATPHTDQGLSLTLFFPDTATTRDINRTQFRAWKMGLKTMYYARVRQTSLAGTNDVEGCVSCAL